MNHILAITLVVSVFVCSSAWSMDEELETGSISVIGNTYSVGYRMGRIDTYDTYGTYGFRSGEGILLMGRDSTPSPPIGDKPGLNPWKFNAQLGTPIDLELKRLNGNYVIIKYQQLQFTSDDWMSSYSTDYRVLNVKEVEEDLTPETCVAGVPGGWKKDGESVGRVVKISRKGTAFKTYESIVHIGTSGPKFRELSVADEKMAKCMYKWLKSGKKAKISYTKAYIPIAILQDSPYGIEKIEPVTTNELRD